MGLKRGSSRTLAAPRRQSLAVPALSALRLATRGLKTINHSAAAARDAKPVGARLRRADAIAWSQPTYTGPRRPRPRSAAPWRG